MEIFSVSESTIKFHLHLMRWIALFVTGRASGSLNRDYRGGRHQSTVLTKLALCKLCGFEELCRAGQFKLKVVMEKKLLDMGFEQSKSSLCTHT